MKVRPKARTESALWCFMNCACLRPSIIIIFFITSEEQSLPALQEVVFMAAGVFQNLIVCAMMSCSNTTAAIDKDTPSVLRSHGLCVYRAILVR